MKNKTTARFAQRLGFIVVMTVIGFSFAACGDGSGGGNQGTAPTITTTSLPNGTVNTAYSQTLAVKGDTPVTWSLESGTLPTGLNLAATGTIAGTPTAATTFTFTVKAENAAGSDTKQLSITITGGGNQGTAPAITTTSLPGGTVGDAYNQTLAATGDEPITWRVSVGTLPAGLTLQSNTISGTPIAAGTSTFTVRATNAAGSNTKSLSIIITGGDIQEPGIEGMVQIQGGTFTMGSPTSEPGRDGTPGMETQHQVTLTGFRMGKYPVTQAQYEAVMESNPSAHKVGGSRASYLGDITDTTNFPVEMVSWYNALVFCNKLSVNEGLTPAYRISGSTDPSVWGTVPTSNNETWNNVEIVAGSTGYRLPTEAQWEYACRAGKTTAFNWGTNYINETQANYNASYVDTNNTVAGTNLNRTTEVGSYDPNDWGLYDMHGNVYELCWDRYGSYSADPQTDPTGPVSGGNRMYRGGSWREDGKHLRSAWRDMWYHYSGRDQLGFRLVLPAE